MLRQIAEALGAVVRVSIEIPKPGTGHDEVSLFSDQALFADSSVVGGVEAPRLPDEPLEDRRVVTNERFIRRVREQYPECPLTNSQIGRRMWQFAHSRGAVLMKGRKQLRPSLSPSIVSYRVPTTSAEYAVRESDIVALDRFADRLGRAFKDDRGRVLVPVK